MKINKLLMVLPAIFLCSCTPSNAKNGFIKYQEEVEKIYGNSDNLTIEYKDVTFYYLNEEDIIYYDVVYDLIVIDEINSIEEYFLYDVDENKITYLSENDFNEISFANYQSGALL